MTNSTKPFTVQGRNGKIYILTDNVVNIIEDAPGEEYCYTVIFLKNRKVEWTTQTDASFLEHLSNDEELSKRFSIVGPSH